MTSNKETAEQRQEKWFRVEDGAFVVLNPADPKVGRIIDISTGGLAFAYIGREMPLQESTEVNIFSGDCSFCLYKVPCDVILDLGPNVSDFAPLSIRRCSVKFGKLKQNQISELKRFIRNHTLGQA
jgi:hypothetical protein